MTVEPLIPPSAPVRVAVFGGTGYAGRYIVHEAAGRGHEVRVYSRKAVIDGSSKDTVSFHQGSVFDPEVVTDAAQWADVIIVAIRGADTGDGPLVNAVPLLLEQAAQHRVRLGVIGGAGSLQVSEGGPLLLEGEDFIAEWLPEAQGQLDVLNALRAQAPYQELELDQSPAQPDWFYVSPAPIFGSFAPGQALGRYRLSGDVLLAGEGDQPAEISGADLALAVVDEVDDPQHHRLRFSVAH